MIKLITFMNNFALYGTGHNTVRSSFRLLRPLGTVLGDIHSFEF